MNTPGAQHTQGDRPLTMIEKIVARHVVRDAGQSHSGAPSPGAFVRIRPKHVMTHDNTAAVIPKFASIVDGLDAAPAIADPRQPVFTIDHDIQNNSAENLGKYAKIESFAKSHGVDFYRQGTGIGHQVMCERGYVTPGSMVVASDSHSNLYGALGCLGTPVVRTDAACIWATGETWWRVPPVVRVELRGGLRNGASGKDVIIALCGAFNRGEVLNCVVEFTGEAVSGLSIAERMAICNMTTEWGALAGVMPFDERTRDYLYERAEKIARGPVPGHERLARAHIDALWSERESFSPDEGADYARELVLDVSTVTPHASGPNSVEVMRSVADLALEGITIQKAYLLSCVNGRLEDLRAAAVVLNGERVAPGVEFYVAPASAEVQADAESDGTWQTLMDAGAIALPSGCGPCIGLGAGTVGAGEVAISATNRNFKGRMGHRDAQVYLASPTVVAASARAGRITLPDAHDAGDAPELVAFEKERSSNAPTTRVDARAKPASDTRIEGFPATIGGRCVFIDADSVNTDGIYAGKWTYKEGLTAEQMAAVVFENLDPALTESVRKGDVIVAGANFGTGSSREQAATALKHRGVSAVIAASFSETYRRNAYNNGFICIDCPALVERVRAARADITNQHADASNRSQLWADLGPIEIDFERCVVVHGEHEFVFDAVPPVMQELIVAGGAEAACRTRLRSTSARAQGVSV